MIIKIFHFLYLQLKKRGLFNEKHPHRLPTKIRHFTRHI